MSKLTIVMGATATGKTYFINQRYAEKDVDCLNVYDYQQKVFKEAGGENGLPMQMHFKCLYRANEQLLEDVIERLKQGRDVVIEQTFYKAKRRIAYIDEVRKNVPDVSIELYIMCPGETQWKENLEKRKMHWNEVNGMVEGIEFPNPAEGIDAIYEVVNGEITLKMEPPKPELLETARRELAEERARMDAEDKAEQERDALFESMNTRKFWHYCEVCGRKELKTAEEAYEEGWDYPPKMGHFGLLSPRTCGDCSIIATLFWKVTNGGGLPIVIESALTPEELIVWRRIKGEPESLLTEEEE